MYYIGSVKQGAQYVSTWFAVVKIVVGSNRPHVDDGQKLVCVWGAYKSNASVRGACRANRRHLNLALWFSPGGRTTPVATLCSTESITLPDTCSGTRRWFTLHEAELHSEPRYQIYDNGLRARRTWAMLYRGNTYPN